MAKVTRIHESPTAALMVVWKRQLHKYLLSESPNQCP